MADSTDTLHIRLSQLEGRVNAIPDPTTSTTTTVTNTVGGGTFTAVTETALGLTQDGAWHSTTVAGIPASAKSLLILIKQKSTSTITTESFLVGPTGHATTYTVAYQDSDLGSNRFEHVMQVIAPVGATFDYNIGNASGNWTVSASIQGYFG